MKVEIFQDLIGWGSTRTTARRASLVRGFPLSSARAVRSGLASLGQQNEAAGKQSTERSTGSLCPTEVPDYLLSSLVIPCNLW